MYYGNSGATEPAADSTYGSQNVWDADFKAVYHMVDATTSTILDSTGNDNDGTKKDANEPIEVDAVIGKGQDFDGVDDNIQIPDSNSLDSDYITLEAIIKNPGSADIEQIFSRDKPDRYWQFRKTTSDKLEFIPFNADTNGSIISATDIADDTFHYVCGVWDGSNINLYVDGASDATAAASSTDPNYDNLAVDDVLVTNSDDDEPASSGGGGMPSAWLNPPRAPEGGFKILINNDAKYTDNPTVTLNLFGGPDAARMAISNNPEFSGAGSTGQITYQSSYQWNLC